MKAATRCEFMTVAGAFFSEEDQSSRCGEIRLMAGTVEGFLDGEDVRRKGLLVQMYREIDEDQFGWETVCPVTDAYFLLRSCPKHLAAASRYLRGMVERGENVTIDIERSAIAKATGEAA